MTDNPNKLAELIEINLLFAKIELSAVFSDPSAAARALRHIEDALKDVRAHKRGASKKAKNVQTVAA